jgi:cytochrome c oxidase subunit 2
VRRLVTLLMAAAGAGCAGPASTLAPRGPAAEDIARLSWVLIVVAAAAYVLVLAMLAAALRRGPRPSRHDLWARLGVIGGGIALPVAAIIPLFIVSVRTLAAVTRPEAPGLVVEIVGHQYWWELRYPAAGPGEIVVTANELHLPVGRPVELRIRATDVIHSVWVPALHGKLDAVPGKVNVTWLRADRPGTYQGQCAEYCGVQHALMRLLVVAQPPAEFEAWLADQRRPASPAVDEAGRRAEALFLVHCGHCHAVRGTPAVGKIAPDLTHVASRRTLAAGTLPHVKGNLAGWIADPQGLKPGSLMPRVPLPPEEFHLVLDYVAGLR